MVVTGAAGSEIEIRLRKITGGAPPGEPIYFDEYASAAKRNDGYDKVKDGEHKITMTRQIIPENARYAIEVTLKKGFCRGKYKYGRFGLTVEDLNSKVRFVTVQWVDFELGDAPLEEDLEAVLSHVPQAVINGEVRDEVELSFQSLSLDETLDPDSGGNGNESRRESGILVCLSRFSERISKPRKSKHFAKTMARYEEQLATGSDTFAKSQEVSEKDLRKRGISHETSLTGGNLSSAPLQKPNQSYVSAKFIERRHCKFVLHTSDYLERQNMRKTPIPLELYSWGCLKYPEKQRCFRALQEQDKEFVLQRQLLEAGPNANHEAIRQQLFHEGDFPRRWLPWTLHITEARQNLYETLQKRILCFKKGENPPEDSPNTPPNIRNDDSPENNERTRSANIKKENPETPAIISLDSDSEDEPILIVRDDAVKLKPFVPAFSNNEAANRSGNARNKPIDLEVDDIDTPSASKNINQNRTIKNEPIDLDAFVSPPPHSNLARVGSNTIKREEGAKNTTGIKREYEESQAAELEKLKEEDDDLTMELELIAKERELRQKRRVKRARISAIEGTQRS